jgi:putative SOS response-associated peptidase YedK
MAVAGVWTEDEDGPAFAVLTYRANLAISPLHDRMPAVLAPDAWPSWLSDEPLTGPELATLIQSASPALFRVELMGAA